MNRTDSWHNNLESLKAFVAQTGHFPGKHTRLNNLVPVSEEADKGRYDAGGAEEAV